MPTGRWAWRTGPWSRRLVARRSTRSWSWGLREWHGPHSAALVLSVDWEGRGSPLPRGVVSDQATQQEVLRARSVVGDQRSGPDVRSDVVALEPGLVLDDLEPPLHGVR